MKKGIYIYLLSLLNTLSIYGQYTPQKEYSDSDPDNNQSSSFPMINALEPIEPTTASLGKYGAYNMNYSKGLPDISFTLYEIKSGDLTIPIILQYQAGGIKVTQESTWVGLGWNLSYGGQITRTVNGYPDEQEEPTATDIPNKGAVKEYMKKFADQQYADFFSDQYLRELSNDSFDNSFMPDQYYYTIGDESGSFIGQSCEALLPYKPFKFNTPYQIINNKGEIFTFTDGDMEKKNTTHSRDFISSWNIKRIESPNKSTIAYTYQTDGQYTNVYDRSYYEEYRIKRQVYDYSLTAGPIYNKEIVKIPEKVSGPTRTVTCKKPQYITFKGGRLCFELSAREDIPELKKLDRIAVESLDENNTYKILKWIQFNYSYKDNRLMLDRVVDSINDGTVKLIGKFKYNPNQLPSRNSVSYDYCGYNNGAGGNRIAKREITIDGNNVIFGSGNNDTNESRAQASILMEIQYPTGGRTEFKWENHQYSGTPINSYDVINNPKICDFFGLRIKEIVNYDNIGEVDRKIFNYLNPIDTTLSSGYIAETGELTWLTKKIFVYGKWVSVPDISLGGCFPEITESYFVYDKPRYGLTPDNIYYKNVQVKDVHNGKDNGVTKYEFKTSFDKAYGMEIPLVSDAHNRGQLIQERVYDAEDRMIKKKEYFYHSDTRLNKISRGFKLIRKAEISETGGGCQLSVASLNRFNIATAFDAYDPVDYEYNTDWNRLDSIVEYQYFGSLSNGVKMTIEYTYDDLKSCQPTREITTSSDNLKKIIKTYKYPAQLSDPISKAMLEKNIACIPIEEEVFKGNKLLLKKINKYSAGIDNTAGLFLLDSILIKKGESDLRKEISISKYNAQNNIMQYEMLDQIPMTYLWGYNGRYPIAEIKGATYEQVTNALGYDPEVTISIPNPDIKTIWENLNSISNVQVSAYSYIPSIGMNHAISPSGIVTHYTYDLFGRLKRIRDAEQNIVQENDYHYINQPIVSDTIQWNDPMYYKPLNATISTNPVLNANSILYEEETINIKANASGGSGQYLYYWTRVVDGNPEAVFEGNQTVTLKVPSATDIKYLCRIVDYQTRNTKEVSSETFNIKSLDAKFSNVEYGFNNTKATLVCKKDQTVSFSIDYEALISQTNLTVSIGSNSYTYTKNGTYSVVLNLKAGSYPVNMKFRLGPSSASLTIKGSGKIIPDVTTMSCSME